MKKHQFHKHYGFQTGMQNHIMGNEKYLKLFAWLLKA